MICPTPMSVFAGITLARGETMTAITNMITRRDIQWSLEAVPLPTKEINMKNSRIGIRKCNMRF